ncbi:MAG: hypothetical protein Q9198_003828 [Flavoplaca austrocitrina]
MELMKKVYRPEDINGTSRLNLPNPYPIPNTPFNITFNPPQKPLIHEDVVHCLKHARSQVVSHIKEHGDGPIPNNGEEADHLFYPYKTVSFDIDSNELLEVQRLSYSITAAVLDAFALKMIKEGYFHREAKIVTADSGEQIGEARLGPEGPLRTSHLQVDPLPNPFPLPNTPFSLDFHQVQPGAPLLPRANAFECLITIRREMLQYIGRHGNGPISSLGFQIRGIGVDLAAAHQQTPLRYHDFVAILVTISLKMSREGYYARFADIIMSRGGEILGDVQIYSEHLGRPRIGLGSDASE